ncbi:MAG TPA: hypothetical protein VF395_12185 [Polyangiaceae bacterium]
MKCALTLSAGAVFAWCAAACAGPSDGVVISAVPPSEGFPAVSRALSAHCGSLDCHGQVGRNLRVYGQFGLRLDPATRPDGEETTPLEFDTTYDSLIAIEPEILAAVYADGGRHPERLTMIRKERGTEHHKGNAVFRENDDGDRCLVSWVKGKIDVTACSAASKIQRP